MDNNTTYIVFGVVLAIYVGARLMTRGKSRERKSRKFMENYQRKDDNK